MKKFLCLCLTLCLVLGTLPALAAQDVFRFTTPAQTLFVGDTLPLVLERAGAYEAGEVTYSSSAAGVLAVEANGVVTAVGRGKGSVVATTKANGKTRNASLTLTVKQPVTAVSLQEGKLNLYDAGDAALSGLLPEGTAGAVLVMAQGKTLTVGTQAWPENANDRTVVLTSSDPTVLSVTNRSLRAVKAGACQLILSSKQNPEVTKTYTVLVVTPVEKLTLTVADDTLHTGETVQAQVLVTPANATFQQVTWQSMNPNVAVVDEQGLITAVGRGATHIRATAADGSGKQANLKIEVHLAPTGIAIQNQESTLNMGKTLQLRAHVTPSNANNRRVEWRSSDSTIASVNGNGVVTPVSVGVVTLTAACQDAPSVTDTLTLSIQQPVTSIVPTQDTVTVDVGSSTALGWQVYPANATDGSLSFKSNNTRIATVDEDGTVHGIKRGSTNITLTAKDGSGKRASVRVNVLQPVWGVHMYSDTLSVGKGNTITGKAVLEPENASNTNMTWHSSDSDIATVSGTNNRPRIKGKRWGTATITGVTEDGGYTTSATVKVGNYDKALQIRDLYLQDNKIKISVQNESNMNINYFSFIIETYDIYDNPLPCTTNGSHAMSGSYSRMLYEEEFTAHGRFSFHHFVQPEQPIGRVTMRITGYSTDEGYSRSIRDDRQEVLEFKSPLWQGVIPPAPPTEAPVVTPEPATNTDLTEIPSGGALVPTP